MRPVANEFIIFESLARSASATSDTVINPGYKGLIMMIDITNNPSAVQLRPRIRGEAILSGFAAQIFTNFTTQLFNSMFTFYPGIPLLTAGNAQTENGVMPLAMDFQISNTGAGTVTYSMVGQWLN